MTCSFRVLSVTSVSVTGSRRRPRESWACPAARTLRAQSESGSADTTYRPPLTVSGETGAERGLPVRRPGTVSTWTGPIVSPRRDRASAARLAARSQRGTGLTSGTAGPFGQRNTDAWRRGRDRRLHPMVISSSCMRLPGWAVLRAGTAAMKSCTGWGLQVLGERGSAGVDLVEVEAARRVAGLVGGEGEAAGLAADLGGQFGDLLAELAGQARPGVEDRDHRPRAGVVPADLEALVVQGVTGAAVVAGHGRGSARLLSQGATVSGSPGLMTLTGMSGARRRAASTK